MMFVIATMTFLLATSPGETLAPAEEPPSMELLEYVGNLQQTEDGQLIDPMDMVQETSYPNPKTGTPVRNEPITVDTSGHETH